MTGMMKEGKMRVVEKEVVEGEDSLAVEFEVAGE